MTMMMKIIPCPVCDGHGFNCYSPTENSIGSFMCENCHGTGEIEVPMTNADRVRSMTDEELAEFMYADDYCAFCEHLRDDGLCEIMASETDQPLGNYCRASALRWLRAPVEENRKEDNNEKRHT